MRLKLSLGFILLSLSLWMLGDLYYIRMPVTVYLGVSGAGCGNVKFYYSAHRTETFGSQKMKTEKICITPKNRSISFSENAKKIKNIQLLFAGNYKNLKINTFKISGRKTLDLSNNFSVKEDNSNSQWKINLKKNINVKAAYRFDWKIFLIVTVLSGALIYGLISYAENIKQKQKGSAIDIVFVVFFFIFLFVPMSHLNHELKSVEENRNLASFPLWQKNNMINNNFGRELDTWFSDRFFGRKYFIRFYDQLLYFLAPFKERPHVLVGKNGWLFSPNSGEVANFQNNNLFTEKQLIAIASYLSAIDKWCKENNKKFYFFIAPNKSRIYPEYYPFAKKVRPDSESRAMQLINYLKKNTKVNVAYPLDELLAEKEKDLLYWKSDTHWNLLGAYYGYLALMKQMNITDVLRIEKSKYYKRPIGDINNMYRFLPKDKEMYWAPVFKDDRNCSPSNIYAEHKKVVCRSHKKSERVIMFRDSFASALLDYLSRSFEKVSAYWYHRLTPEDLENIKNDADIVIFEKVERHLHGLVGMEFVGD